MSKPPRDRFVSDSRTYFVSANTWGSRALFQADDIARLFLATLYDYRKLERSLQLIKGGFSFRVRSIVGNKEIWERGYVDHRVRDESDYLHHRAYIHQNPCKAGLAARPETYPYSSAFPGFELDPVPQWLKPFAMASKRHG
jgi:putative transposase